VRWLADQRANPPQGDEFSQLRLESDERLVRVVTMHKSKGLEYPIVFLPFPWSGGGSGSKAPVLFHDAERGTACLDLGSDQQQAHRELAEREDLAQRLRLLYGALWVNAEPISAPPGER
jgi:exodeoxyribonuclease V beta subunit